jgi:hypothetical protein
MWTWTDIIGASICIGGLVWLGYSIWATRHWSLSDYEEQITFMMSRIHSNFTVKAHIRSVLTRNHADISTQFPVSPERDALLKWITELIESLV